MNRAILPVVFLTLLSGAGCSAMRVTTDPEGRISGALYVSVMRQYDVNYEVVGPQGQHIHFVVAARSEPDMLSPLLTAVATYWMVP